MAKANMSMTKNPMPEQEPLVRNKNFEEVALGYTAETAMDEAKRCLKCKKPLCMQGCPVNVRIPEFLAKVAENFEVEEKGTEIYKPVKLHNFSLYLEGKWYSLTAKPGTYDDTDPIGVLDVSVSSNLILDKILGIKDLRSDKRIDFVGGIRGLGELKKRVDSGEMKVALALYPVSMKQLMDIADTGNIMPPKTTWFEPKLRSGLVIHKLD